MAAPSGRPSPPRLMRLVASIVSLGAIAFVLATVIFDATSVPRQALSPDETAEVMKVKWPPRASGLRTATIRDGNQSSCVLARFFLPPADVAAFLAGSPLGDRLSAEQRPGRLLRLRVPSEPWWTPEKAGHFQAAESDGPPNDYAGIIVAADHPDHATVFFAHCGD